MHRFILLCTSLLISVPAYTMNRNPVAVAKIVHKYIDPIGIHTDCYEAYAQGTLEFFKANMKRNKRFAALGGTGVVAGTVLTCTYGLLDMAEYGLGSFNPRKQTQMKNDLIVNGTFTLACLLFGGRALVRSVQVKRMIAQYVPELPFPRHRLDNPHLNNYYPYEFFRMSKATKPLESSVNKI